MAWCKNCNEQIVWSKDGEYWVPIDDDVKSKNYGLDHRKFCSPDQNYIEKRSRIIRDEKLQIDENTFV